MKNRKCLQEVSVSLIAKCMTSTSSFFSLPRPFLQFCGYYLKVTHDCWSTLGHGGVLGRPEWWSRGGKERNNRVVRLKRCAMSQQEVKGGRKMADKTGWAWSPEETAWAETYTCELFWGQEAVRSVAVRLSVSFRVCLCCGGSSGPATDTSRLQSQYPKPLLDLISFCLISTFLGLFFYFSPFPSVIECR